jgi:hypothetical protein
MKSVWAVVQNGEILPEEPVELRNGQRVLVTILAEDENEFWLAAADPVLNAIWQNEEDDVYAELLAL